MTGEDRGIGIYRRGLERFGRSAPGNWFLTKVAPRIDPPLLRISGGRFSSAYPVPVMLLTTTGAKSGLPRQLPLLYATDGDSLILVASNYGRPGHPAWYRNLKANPTVEVLAGKHRGSYSASEITDPAERADAWAKALDVYAGYSDYEERAAGRQIPLIRLRRST
ncbi:MAG: nitroreductase family deazaflavin-dependent oxidoreductase [Mycolicibacterium sp.]|uniref:nitroreductase family deazaflavin-dependent oxidoreductase n=1 Tax=Mycolicibacterium sp. TaxID=2320850 RepID=UPI003D1215E5